MVCMLWMAARIWKSSPILAIVSFLFLPAAIIPLIQNWGDEESDIKPGVASADSTFSWDSPKRQAALESQGIVGEVLFPNTAPPFFPGGVLIGCSAGFVNVPRIKGSHNAMKTGMLAAETAFKALQAGRAGDELSAYQDAYEHSWVYEDLSRVRNVKPMWSKLGLVGGLALGGADMWLNQLFGFGFGTWKHGKPDYATLRPA